MSILIFYPDEIYDLVLSDDNVRENYFKSDENFEIYLVDDNSIVCNKIFLTDKMIKNNELMDNLPRNISGTIYYLGDDKIDLINKKVVNYDMVVKNALFKKKINCFIKINPNQKYVLLLMMLDDHFDVAIDNIVTEKYNILIYFN